MGKIVIDIKDKSKEKTLLEFLRDIPFIEIENDEPKSVRKISEFRFLYGLWKDRDIDISILREKAWGISK